MNHEELKQHVDSRFDRLELKLDKLGEGVVEASTDVTWLKGSVKLIWTIILSAAGFLAAAYFKLIQH
jgi:hypothetical protein